VEEQKGEVKLQFKAADCKWKLEGEVKGERPENPT